MLDNGMEENELLTMKAKINAIRTELNAGVRDLEAGHKDGADAMTLLKEMRDALNGIN